MGRGRLPGWRRAPRGAVGGGRARSGPGESGLLALDWNNGNRTILVDPRLSGLVLGQTLHTTRAEVYRALIEATAFGARAIIERLQEYGVPVERVVCCGGIAEKNDLFMQIYADVLGYPMLVAGSPQTPALGSAIAAAVTAGVHPSFEAAQARMTSLKEKAFTPNRGGAGGVRRAVPHVPGAARHLRRRPRGEGRSRNAHEEAARCPGATGALARMVAMSQVIAELRESVYRANKELAGSGLVHGTFGNVSGVRPRGRACS